VRNIARLAGLLTLLSSGVIHAATLSERIEADWLRQAELRGAPAQFQGRVTPNEDAAGACDGHKDGKWGFHTANEEQPWWQVDLGAPTALDHLLIYNRCDTCASRNNRLIVLVSDDAKIWRQVFRPTCPSRKPGSFTSKPVGRCGRWPWPTRCWTSTIYYL